MMTDLFPYGGKLVTQFRETYNFHDETYLLFKALADAQYL